MELSDHVVDFEKRRAIKSHVLTHFIVDWTEHSSYTEGTVTETTCKYIVMEPGGSTELERQQY
jgi:hypothetical protein